MGRPLPPRPPLPPPTTQTEETRLWGGETTPNPQLWPFWDPGGSPQTPPTLPGPAQCPPGVPPPSGLDACGCLSSAFSHRGAQQPAPPAPRGLPEGAPLQVPPPPPHPHPGPSPDLEEEKAKSEGWRWASCRAGPARPLQAASLTWGRGEGYMGPGGGVCGAGGWGTWGRGWGLWGQGVSPGQTGATG